MFLIRSIVTFDQIVKINGYDVDGFFFDEMPTTFVMDGMTDLERRRIFNYYTDLYNFVDRYEDHSYVVGNPGNLTKERFLNEPTADALVTLENDMSAQAVFDPPPAGALAYTPAPWQTSSSHDPTEFALIQHNVPATANMTAVVDAGLKKGFGLFYVTDDTTADSNPFDRLPSYWDAFVQKIKSVSN